MAGPALWLVAGPNGAGKTTAVQRRPITELLPTGLALNADDWTLELLHAAGYAHFEDAPPEILRATFIEAAEQTFTVAKNALAQGETVIVETVLSTRKFEPLVELAHERSGIFGLIYIALASSAVSAARVRRRVERGGHDVPADRLAARWQRSAENLGWFARRADMFWVLNNTDSKRDHPLPLLANGGEGKLEIHDADAIPAITESLVAAFSGHLPR